MCDCLNKLTSKYGKRIDLIFYALCIKLEESQSHHFPIHSYNVLLGRFPPNFFKNSPFFWKILMIPPQKCNKPLL